MIAEEEKKIAAEAAIAAMEAELARHNAQHGGGGEARGSEGG